MRVLCSDFLVRPTRSRWISSRSARAKLADGSNHLWGASAALSLADTVGLKTRAWHDRFVIRDIIDLHAAAGAFSFIDLESLGRRHDPDLDLEAILDHLAGVSVFADSDFSDYGLDEVTIVDLRRWVTEWYDDLARRLAADCDSDEDGLS